MRANVGDFALTLLAAAAVTYLLTPLVRRFATAIGASHAARDRDVHVVPTPLLGGVAMYAGLATALLVASQLSGLSGVFAGTGIGKGLLLAGGLLVVMGFVDDRWGMSALSKLAGQIAAGMVLVWSGAAVIWIPLPGGGTLSLNYEGSAGITILLVVVTINAVNFIDGLDGLATGVVGIGAVSFFIYYYTLTVRLDLTDQTAPALASAMLIGMCLGFLPHNFHPAKIFMGDTGSMLIGLLLAYVPISSLASLDAGSLVGHGAYASGTVNRFGTILPLLLPAAIMLIPYADLLMAVVRRTRAGMSPFAPDKKHLHHRLLDIGHSHRTTVLIMYLWAALFAGSVTWLSIVETPLPVLVGVTIACVLGLLLVSMPRLRPWARDPEALADGAEVTPGPVPDRPARSRRARERQVAPRTSPSLAAAARQAGVPGDTRQTGELPRTAASEQPTGPGAAEAPLPHLLSAPPPNGAAHDPPAAQFLGSGRARRGVGAAPLAPSSAGFPDRPVPESGAGSAPRPEPGSGAGSAAAARRPAAPPWEPAAPPWPPAAPPWQAAAPPPGPPAVSDAPGEQARGRRGDRPA